MRPSYEPASKLPPSLMSVLFETPRSAEPPISIGRCGASALITSPLATRVAIGLASSKSGRCFSQSAGNSPFIVVAHSSPSSACSLAKLFHQRAPFCFLLRAAFNRFTKMRQRFIGNVKLLVFGPTQMPFRFAHRFFARRVAVRLARAGGRHAITNDRLD